MALWHVERFECNPAGPVLGHTYCQFVMVDLETPGSTKYELGNYLSSDLISNPQWILIDLNARGYTPNDFGLTLE